MRVRKRVTLMVITVSVIFVMCWGTNQVIYGLLYHTTYYISPVSMAVAYTMVMFNSAVNPFVYALLNQKFRNKVKELKCCRVCCFPLHSSANRVHSEDETQVMELAFHNTHATQCTDPHSTEDHVPRKSDHFLLVRLE